MGNKKNLIDFKNIDSNEKVIELAEKDVLTPIYLIPLIFNGEESTRNKLFVPPFVAQLKEKCDNMVEKLLKNKLVNSYSCTPEYKGDSFIPSKLTIEATKDGKSVFVETINIW